VWEYWGEVGGQKCENMLGIMYFWDSLKDVSTWTVPQWIITVDDVSDFLANKPVWIYPSPTIRCHMRSNYAGSKRAKHSSNQPLFGAVYSRAYGTQEWCEVLNANCMLTV
jgi:hypothetical protein